MKVPFLLGAFQARVAEPTAASSVETLANVVEAEPGHRFSFIVRALGGDWTQWTYLIEPGSTAGTTRLTEGFQMCVPLPWAAAAFDNLFLLVRDRRADLQKNLDASVEGIRTIVEAGVDA